MRTRITLTLLALAAAAAACRQPPAPPPPPPRPSIVLLSVDTLRPDHLPAWGYHRETAPFVTGLLADGTRYTAAESTSSWTVPALASLLTGVYPATHGVVHGVTRGNLPDAQEVIPASLPGLGATLQQLGYHTYAAVANLHAHPDFGFARGFDSYTCVGFEPAPAVNLAVERWRSELESATGPVFLWIHFFDPHYPLHAREPWAGQFRPGTDQDDVALVDELADAWPAPGPALLADIDRRLDIGRALYDSEIRYADDSIRRLYESLPFLRDWVTVFTADHGEEFLEHGDLGHSFNLQAETVRIPLVIRLPGASGPATVDAPVSLVDLAPTLVTVAGGTPPASWQGIPLVTADGRVRADLPADRELLASLERFPNRRQRHALIGAEWKLIVGPDDGRWLYDVRRDPHETENLAADRPWLTADLAKRLAARLAALPRAPDIERKTLTDDQRAQLERLGYLERSEE